MSITTVALPVALVLPAATPADIRNRLHAEVVKILRAQDIRDKLHAMGAEAIGNSQEEFGAFIKSETAKWARVIKASGTRVE